MLELQHEVKDLHILRQVKVREILFKDGRNLFKFKSDIILNIFSENINFGIKLIIFAVVKGRL